MQQKVQWYNEKPCWWQCLLIILLFLTVYHYLLPKQHILGMVDIHGISQEYLHFIASASLAPEEQAYWLEIFSRELDTELARLSDKIVLIEARYAVTPLPDYTDCIKQSISDALEVQLNHSID